MFCKLLFANDKQRCSFVNRCILPVTCAYTNFAMDMQQDAGTFALYTSATLAG